MDSEHLIRKGQKAYSLYEMYRAVKLSISSLDMEPVCHDLNYFLTVVTYNINQKKSKTSKLKRGISPPIIERSELPWLIYHYSSYASQGQREYSI